MTIDLDRIANLARLNLGTRDYKDEIENILTWIESLQEVDISDVETQATVKDVVLERRDEVLIADQSADILANAPDKKLGFFAVPKVIE